MRAAAMDEHVRPRPTRQLDGDALGAVQEVGLVDGGDLAVLEDDSSGRDGGDDVVLAAGVDQGRGGIVQRHQLRPTRVEQEEVGPHPGREVGDVVPAEHAGTDANVRARAAGAGARRA